MALVIPKNYFPIMQLRQTEMAIKKLKERFERELARELNLVRVTAPLFSWI